jgi:hypothetical protein
MVYGAGAGVELWGVPLGCFDPPEKTGTREKTVNTMAIEIFFMITTP